MIRSPPDIEMIRRLSALIAHKPSNISTIKSFFDKVQNKYYAKLIYGLSILKFSSYWELSTILNLGDMRQIRRCINMFIEDGTVTILKKQIEDFQIVERFWKKQYPTSPCLPTLFILTKEWTNIAAALEGYLARFFSTDELAAIKYRAKRYEDHHTIVKNQINLRKERIKNSLGTCHECNKIISKNMEEVRDYKKYGDMFVCATCHFKAEPNQIRKWISQNS